MGQHAEDPIIRNKHEQALADMADRLAVRFSERAPLHDSQGSFPFDNVEDLKNAGYLKLTVPKAYGGDEISLYELVLVQERIARGDGSTALAVGWHMGLVLHLRMTRKWPEEIFRYLCREAVERGSMINSLASEPATGSPSRGGKPQTTARKTEGGWLITGRKTYSTLSPVLDRFFVSASIEGEDRVGEFLLERSRQVRIEETWNTLGMRATGSHDVIFEDAFVAEGSMIDKGGPLSDAEAFDDGGGWLLHIPAVYLGIARAARDAALQFAKSYRPNSLPGPISELPAVQQQIGLMEAKLMTAGTVLYAIADLWDKTEGSRAHLKPQLGHAKFVVTNEAINIVDMAMRIVGGSSLSRSMPLERLYRDVRAGLHNPPMDDSVLRNLAQRAIHEEK